MPFDPHPSSPRPPLLPPPPSPFSLLPRLDGHPAADSSLSTSTLTLLAARQTGNEHFDQDRSSQLPMIAGTTTRCSSRRASTAWKAGPLMSRVTLTHSLPSAHLRLLNHVSICRHFYRTRDVCVCVCLCDCWTKRGRNCKLWVLYGFEMREWRVQLRWLWFLGLGGARCQKNWMGCRENYFRYSMFLVFLFESDYFLRCTFLDGILGNFYYPFYQDGNLLEFSRGFF